MEDNTDNSDKSFGFFILRCVKKKEHDFAWQECYDCIRKLYECPIIIIDDNSNKNFLTPDKELINTTIIDSEYCGVGELLPYYYFYQLHPFEKAIMLHDSMFIKEKINIDNVEVKFLWHFVTHGCDNGILETRYISHLQNNSDLLNFYKSKKWHGCFGTMCVMDYAFVTLLNDKYDLFILLRHIKVRQHRMALERIIATIIFFENKVTLNDCSFYGCIHSFPLAFRLNYELYKKIELHRPIIKVWFSR